MKEISVTISDVATAADVSIRTVSRVLNNSPLVNERTRGDVRATIERLGFTPNSRARGLAAGRSFLIGVVQDDPNTHVIGIFQRAIAELCSESGYELVVHSPRFDDKLAEDVLGFARRSHIDGLILLPPLSELPAVVEALTAIGVPVVGIASVHVPFYPAMHLSDERSGASSIGNYLVGLGHHRIGLITGSAHFCSSSEREKGFRDALAGHGITLPSIYVCEGDYGFASGFAAAESLLSLPQPPTAIFASNDIMAAAVLQSAASRGVAVPKQLSVVGFDDSDLASMLTPALTTVHRPMCAMARDATQRLLAIISGSPPPPDHNIVMKLIERQSAGPVSDMPSL